MFNSPPEVSSLSDSYKTWMRIGPMKIDEIVENSDVAVVINDEICEFG